MKINRVKTRFSFFYFIKSFSVKDEKSQIFHDPVITSNEFSDDGFPDKFNLNIDHFGHQLRHEFTALQDDNEDIPVYVIDKTTGQPKNAQLINEKKVKKLIVGSFL